MGARITTTFHQHRKVGLSVITYQNPYMEQQFPFGQLPQTVLPFEAPQVPSVVVASAFGGVVAVTGAITGSAVVVAAGWL